MSDQQALNILMKSQISQDMLTHIVNVTLNVIQCKKSDDFYPSPPTSPTRKSKLPSLMKFLTKLVKYTNVYTGTFLTTLVYLERLRSKLPKNAEGLPCTLHRIFLACLILSAKFHNDSSPKNIHWATYTDGLFKTEDVNLMERQLLSLLNWDLQVSNTELVHSLRRFIDPIKNDLRKAAKVRRSIAKQRQVQQYYQQQQQEQQIKLQQQQIFAHAVSTQLHSRSLSNSSSSSIDSIPEEIAAPIIKSTYLQQPQQQYQKYKAIDPSYGYQNYNASADISYQYNQFNSHLSWS